MVCQPYRVSLYKTKPTTAKTKPVPATRTISSVTPLPESGNHPTQRSMKSIVVAFMVSVGEPDSGDDHWRLGQIRQFDQATTGERDIERRFARGGDWVVDTLGRAT